MPTISIFYGIIIRMFYEDHAPPHLHAQYGDYKASVGIDTLEIIDGNLPRRALGLVLDWAELHKVELLENWSRCRDHLEPIPIEPLQ